MLGFKHFAGCLIIFFTALAYNSTDASAKTLFVDTSGVNSAYGSITDALAAAHSGDEIILSSGVYNVSTEEFPLIIDKVITIRADEGATPVIETPTRTQAFRIVAPGVVINGLSFHFLGAGIWVLADDVTISRCTFKLVNTRMRTSSCGMWLAGAKNLKIFDNLFVECGVALAGPPLSEKSLELPVLTGLFEVGEDIEYFTTHTMTNNSVNNKPLIYLTGESNVSTFDDMGIAEAGQLIAVGCNDMRISGLDVSNTSMGIQLVYCDSIIVENVIADNCGIFGTYTAKSADCTIRNVRSDNSTHGIDLRAVHNIIVSECKTDNCDQGIFFSWAENCLITNSDITNNGFGFFTANGKHNQMHNCRMVGNDTGVFIQEESSFLITDCYIAKSENFGIRLIFSSANCVSATFEDNWVGAAILESEYVTFYGNMFVENKQRALYIQQSNYIKLINNLFNNPEIDLIEIINSYNVISFDDTLLRNPGGVLDSVYRK